MALKGNFGNYRLCHCRDCRSAPSHIWGEFQRNLNRRGRHEARTAVLAALDQLEQDRADDAREASLDAWEAKFGPWPSGRWRSDNRYERYSAAHRPVRRVTV